MGNETSSPSKRSSGKRKDQKQKPKSGKQSLSGLSVIEEVFTCDDTTTKETENVHSNGKGESTENNDINAELRKPPESNGNVKTNENRNSSDSEKNIDKVKVNSEEQNKEDSPELSKIPEPVTSDDTIVSESRGKPTLKELATNQTNGQHVDNLTEELSDNAAAEIRLEMLKQDEAEETKEQTSPDTSESSAVENSMKQSQNDNGNKPGQQQETHVDDKQEEIQNPKEGPVIDSNDNPVKLRNKDSSNKKSKSDKKNKKLSSKKSKSGQQESVSYDTKPESSVSSAHSSESVSINMSSDLDLSSTSVDNSMDRSSSSIAESGKKGKQKVKKSPSKSSSGSNDSKEKKKKKNKPTGIGNKNLPRDNSSPIEKRRSIFDDEIIIDTSLGDDNLEVVSLSSSDGDDEETKNVSTMNISTIDSSPETMDVYVSTTTSEPDDVTSPISRASPYSIQQLSVQDVSPPSGSSSRTQRTFYTFQYNRKISPYNGSKCSGLILRQNSDISYDAEERRKVILTRPLSFEGTSSKSWIAKHNSFSEILKKSTAVLSPRYRKQEGKTDGKSMDPNTSIVYI